MNNMLDEPLELLDEDLDAVSGGDAVFNFNNFAANQGTQLIDLTGATVVFPGGSVSFG